ncbi:hypothetical protein BST85_10565 [Aureitalea marina]|uniref:UPF0102 protein BST85_10565 n=2 Tax=Aureitalea marina TaxID=930804 RepID=A0A2S7KU50_9FLAO|nr:hypothetical protein BST85_10565 [Aureitalea marina]
MAYHNELGKQGEEYAANFLLEQGYTILKRNYRYDRAEIDIIAQKEPSTLVVVEVKTRNSSAFGGPQEFVNRSKINQLVKAADHYVCNGVLETEVRFDVIAVLINKKQIKLDHYPAAFYHF